MDPSKHSNRPLPQEPVPEPIHERNQPGGGDYASLTRIKEKWPSKTSFFIHCLTMTSLFTKGQIL